MSRRRGTSAQRTAEMEQELDILNKEATPAEGIEPLRFTEETDRTTRGVSLEGIIEFMQQLNKKMDNNDTIKQQMKQDSETLKQQIREDINLNNETR